MSRQTGRVMHRIELFIDYIMMPNGFVMDTTIDIPFKASFFFSELTTVTTMDWNNSADNLKLSIQTDKDADINILSNFTVVIAKEDRNVQVRGTVMDVFNPWKSEKQRSAILAKRNKSKGKKRKYYDRMIKKWDIHSK